MIGSQHLDNEPQVPTKSKKTSGFIVNTVVIESKGKDTYFNNLVNTANWKYNRKRLDDN